MVKVKAVLTSRKFWATVLAVGVVIAKTYDPSLMSDPAMLSIVGALSAYVVGTGLDNGATPVSK
jgi:hypothetical protein